GASRGETAAGARAGLRACVPAARLESSGASLLRDVLSLRGTAQFHSSAREFGRGSRRRCSGGGAGGGARRSGGNIGGATLRPHALARSASRLPALRPVAGNSPAHRVCAALPLPPALESSARPSLRSRGDLHPLKPP